MDSPYLALTRGRRYRLDGTDQDPPDWHEMHVALSRLPRFHGYSRVSVLPLDAARNPKETDRAS